MRLSSLFYYIKPYGCDRKCADESGKRKSNGSSRGGREILKVRFLKILFQNSKIRSQGIRVVPSGHNSQCSDFPEVDQPPNNIFHSLPQIPVFLASSLPIRWIHAADQRNLHSRIGLTPRNPPIPILLGFYENSI